MRHGSFIIEFIIAVSVIAIIAAIAIPNLINSAEKKAAPSPPGSFGEPTASITDLGSSNGWHLYKLSVKGHDQFVWRNGGAAAIVVVPPVEPQSRTLEQP